MEEKEKKQDEVKKSAEEINNTEKKVDTKKQGVKKEEDKDKVKGKVTVENKKANKKPIITTIAIIIILILIVLLYMFLGNGPKNTVEDMFKAIKDGDHEKVNEYINYQELVSSSEVLNSENLDEETMKLLFEKLSWNITEVIQEKDTANVTVDVTNKNFRTIIGNYMQKVLRVAFSGQELNDSEMENYLLEELRNQDVETTTTTQTINLTKQEGKWMISTDNSDLINILLPGLNEAINFLS